VRKVHFGEIKQAAGDSRAADQSGGADADLVLRAAEV
jgi:hypothetical protein